jgi:dipeptide/tripeptide permease
MVQRDYNGGVGGPLLVPNNGIALIPVIAAAQMATPSEPEDSNVVIEVSLFIPGVIFFSYFGNDEALALVDDLSTREQIAIFASFAAFFVLMTIAIYSGCCCQCVGRRRLRNRTLTTVGILAYFFIGLVFYLIRPPSDEHATKQQIALNYLFLSFVCFSIACVLTFTWRVSRATNRRLQQRT